ncbi:hypothetical protein BMETH_673_1 [methanotrophic bacterial endosymbiont of Bathymodiolus sp.]|nr:hypothetical protein BMETH_673_1 [methanotrophic bacterial endosymbiont of Bathymodiolus sp.]
MALARLQVFVGIGRLKPRPTIKLVILRTATVAVF